MRMASDDIWRAAVVRSEIRLYTLIRHITVIAFVSVSGW